MPTTKETTKKEVHHKAAVSKPAVAAKAPVPAGRQAAAPKVSRAKKVKPEGALPHLRIRVRAYEHKILDASLKQIMDTAARYDAEINGPVPLPTEIKKYTVNRSSFIDKNSREQFEMRVHKRLIELNSTTSKTVDELMKLDLPAGVDVEIKL